MRCGTDLLLQRRLHSRNLLLQRWSRVTDRPVVLVVEDDPSLRTTMCAVLTLQDFFPLWAESVDAALKILGEEHVDAIVLDVRLPDSTGRYKSVSTSCSSSERRPNMWTCRSLVFTGMPLSPYEEESCAPTAHTCSTSLNRTLSCSST